MGAEPAWDLQKGEESHTGREKAKGCPGEDPYSLQRKVRGMYVPGPDPGHGARKLGVGSL